MNRAYFLMLIAVFFSSATAGEIPESPVVKGQRAYNARDYNTALNCFKDAIVSQPAEGNIHYDLGRTYLAQGAHDEAAKHFYQAGLLFLGKDDKGGALRAYTMLRKTRAKDLEQSLLEKLYPSIKNNRC